MPVTTNPQKSCTDNYIVIFMHTLYTVVIASVRGRQIQNMKILLIEICHLVNCVVYMIHRTAYIMIVKKEIEIQPGFKPGSSEIRSQHIL